jgi:hypothetical protein
VLALYEDAHLDTAEKLLASRSLLWILAARSPVLERDARRIRVPAGRQLAALRFAPLHEEAWKGAFDTILERLPYLRSVFVRKQLTAYLETDHAGPRPISLAPSSCRLAARLTALASLLGKVAGTEPSVTRGWSSRSSTIRWWPRWSPSAWRRWWRRPVSIADACSSARCTRDRHLGAHFLGADPKDRPSLVAVQALRARKPRARRS